MKHLSEHSKVDTKHLWHIRAGTEPSKEPEGAQVFDKGREHLVWRFANDYGVSISCHSLSHWTPELAVVKFNGTKNDFKLVYTTPVTGDVIWNIEASELPAIFETIKNL